MISYKRLEIEPDRERIYFMVVLQHKTLVMLYETPTSSFRNVMLLLE